MSYALFTRSARCRRNGGEPKGDARTVCSSISIPTTRALVPCYKRRFGRQTLVTGAGSRDFDGSAVEASVRRRSGRRRGVSPVSRESTYDDRHGEERWTQLRGDRR